MTNTLTFTNYSDITFQFLSNEVKVLVSGNLLGTFTLNNPATLYVTVSGSNKAITFKTITQGQYTQGNTGNQGTDTIYFNQNMIGAQAKIQACSSNPSLNKLCAIGWEDETSDQTCQGGTPGPRGFTNHFNVSGECTFKACMENVTLSTGQEVMMVVRYGSNVMVQQPANSGTCYNGPYCYTCN